MSDPTPDPRRPSWVRRNRVPLLAVGIPVLYRIGLWAMNRFEIGLEHLILAATGFMFVALLGFLTLVVWFFFGSGFSRSTKVAAVVVSVVLVTAFQLAVTKVDYDGQMTPSFHYRWEPAAEQLLTEHLATAPRAPKTADLTIGPSDSPAFRGPAGDGVTPGTRLAADWSTPPRELWRHPVGGGHAGVAVAGNSAVTLEQRGDDEAVVCYDRATGRERWVYSYAAKFTQSGPMGGDGPRTTPAIADGDVYTLGATGELRCLAGDDGQPKWRVNILADNGATNLEWGMSGSPLVVGNLVVVNPGVDPKNNAGQAVAAYDRATGKKVWANGKHPAGYASPQLGSSDGTSILVFDADGLGWYAVADGSELGRFPWKTDMGMNSAQPLRLSDRVVFVSSERSNGCAFAVREKGEWSESRHTRALSARYCSPVVHSGHIFGLSEGRLICLDVVNGKRKWAEGDYGNGQVLRAGDLLVITGEKGTVSLVAADPEEYNELGSVKVFADRTWNMPALAGNQLFVRNHREMACLELPTAK